MHKKDREMLTEEKFKKVAQKVMKTISDTVIVTEDGEAVAFMVIASACELLRWKGFDQDKAMSMFLYIWEK